MSFRDIFAAKFSAVVIAFAVFVLLLTLPAAIVFHAVTGGAFASSFPIMAAACTVAFFGPIALQGALLNVLPPRMFERAMIWLQAIFAAAAIGGFPVAAGTGPAILSGLHLSIHDLYGAALLSPCVAVLIYLVSFHRYRRLLLEAPRPRPPQQHDLLSRLLDLRVADPREQAAFLFICKTLYRSRIHRLALMVYVAVAAAWMVKSAVDVAATTAGERESGGMVVTACVLALILFTLLGLRHLFSIPADLRSNWMFQLTERQGRRAWLNAVERFVLVCGIAPIVLVSTIFLGRSEGLFTAIAWPVVMSFLAAACFEYLFRDWCKLPFTCSYLPGQRPLIFTCAIYAALALVLAPLTWIVYHSATNPFGFLVILGAEVVIWYYLRRSRRARWGLTPLRYVEQPDSEIDTFGLAGDGTTLAQEQFQRQWGDYLRGGRAVPIVRELETGETRTGRVLEWLRDLPQDLRYALRLIMKSPGFGLAVILTLSLGLGLNAAFFTVFNAFLLKPLAVRDPASLVSIDFETKFRTAVNLGRRDVELLGRNVPAFSDVAVSTLEGTGLDGQSSKAGLVSGNYFSMLGARAALGHPFDEGELGAVLVLSHPVWKSRFGGDPNILGRKLMVNGVPFEVIAVTAPEFTGVPVGTVAVAPPKLARYGLGAPDFWVPIEAWNGLPGISEVPARGVVGRLREGVSSQQAQAMVTSYVQRLTSDRVEWERVARATLEELDIPVTWTALTYSLPLLIAFGLTMLIPCANAANLILARAMARQREFGVRLSLGAGRGRLVRQLLTESLLLAVAASGAGLILARVALNFLLRVIYATAPPTILFRVRIPDFSIDWHVFFYMLVISLLTTVLFALAPAAQATRTAVAFALRGEFAGLRTSSLRDALVVGQISACVMLLVTAGVLLRGAQKMTHIDRGYSAVSVFGVANQSPEDANPLLSILKRESWVDTLAFMGRPLNEMDSMRVRAHAQSDWQTLYYSRSSGEFFRLLRIPILQGRTFTEAEAEKRVPVAVVSELAAKQLWPGEDPIGRTLVLEPGKQDNPQLPPFRQAIVIGVSRDVVSKAKEGAPRASIHLPDIMRRGTVLAVRGRGSPEQTRRRMMAALERAPGAAHGARVIALQETIDWETYPQQAASWLSGLLSLLALLLAISGMYGMMSYLVSQRTREIGIRMALGATKGQVARFVFRHSARLAGAGVLFGTVLAVGALRYIANQTDLTIDFYDFPAYLLSVCLMMLAILFATLGPTDRACRVDPQDALRFE